MNNGYVICEYHWVSQYISTTFNSSIWVWNGLNFDPSSSYPRCVAMTKGPFSAGQATSACGLDFLGSEAGAFPIRGILVTHVSNHMFWNMLDRATSRQLISADLVIGIHKPALNISTYFNSVLLKKCVQFFTIFYPNSTVRLWEFATEALHNW